MDNLISTETASTETAQSTDTDTVPMVGNYELLPINKGLYRLRAPNGKIISERFSAESDAKWYATRLTRLANLTGKLFMPKVPGNVGRFTIAPVARGWAVQDTDLATIGPVWTDKKNGKVDAFRYAERCVRQGA